MNINYSIKDIDTVTKAVLREYEIQSSSDFIAIAYKLHEKFFPAMSVRIKPIVELESDNVNDDDWVYNTVFSENRLYNLSSQQLYDCMIAYRIVLDYYLNDDIVSKRFNMDENDILGWKIFKELDTKYNYCRKRLITLNYILESEQTCLS